MNSLDFPISYSLSLFKLYENSHSLFTNIAQYNNLQKRQNSYLKCHITKRTFRFAIIKMHYLTREHKTTT